MLVLSRAIGKAIIINDNVEISVLEVQGNSVRLGINAPKDIPVHREEIYRRIQQDKQSSL